MKAVRKNYAGWKRSETADLLTSMRNVSETIEHYSYRIGICVRQRGG